ncbi:recQ mediated genome instability protein [Sarocladium implicatum]|nr:recQ mediated genome instability protein [Sarocladium implicatum]
MDTTAQLRSSVISLSLPPPSSEFLTTLTTSRSPPPPLPSLIATAKARLLAADLTSSSLIDQSAIAILPESAVQAKEVTLPRNVHVQILDIEDIAHSRWSQADELEAVERGETTRGREVIRVRAEDEQSGNGNSATTTPTTGPGNALHRLVVQDRAGKKMYAIELKRVPGLDIRKTSIGEKMMLRSGTVIARGTILLTPENTVLLGGKIEAWHKTWAEGRLNRLKAAARGGLSETG